MGDPRVRQFWDAHHVVAAALRDMAKQKPSQPKPECCTQRGFDWDEAILYPKGVHWKDVPGSLFWNGPVVRTIQGLEKALEENSTR
jgi:hypothetical protein